MELKPGYKQTEVGVIPEDWEVKALKEISPKQSVGLVINPSTYFDPNESIPMLVGSSVTENRIDAEAANRISAASNFKLVASRLTQGDLVTVRVGDPGVTAVVPPELDQCNCASMMIVRQDRSFNSHWLCSTMNSRHGRQQVENVQYGTAQKQFNIKDAVNFVYAVPPLQEQNEIAMVLGEVELLIMNLEQVITKKRNIKQASMQELLTGKRRLPGFEGEWKVKRLGDVLSICHGKNQRDVEVADGPYPILATGGQIGTSIRPLHSKPSVLIGRKGTINKPQYMDTPFWTVDTLFYSAMKEDNSARFFYYLFCTIDWMRFNEASGVPSLNARTIESVEVGCPDTQEQDAIASVLSELDAELAALEARKDKAQMLKQGMMQQLLTGKIRLI